MLDEVRKISFLKTRTKVANQVIGQANQDIDKIPYLSEFVDLTDEEQILSLKLLWLSFTNVITNRVTLSKKIVLPYIGTLKIRDDNIIAIKHKKQTALELGYEDWKLIPKDKLEAALIKVNKLVINEMNLNRSKLKGKKRRKTNYSIPRVLKFKLSKK